MMDKDLEDKLLDLKSPGECVTTYLHRYGSARRWQLIETLKRYWGYDEVEAGATIDRLAEDGGILCVRNGSESSMEGWRYMLPNSGIGVPTEAEPDQCVKRDAGKPRMSFLLEFPRALTAFVRVCEYGAGKYGRGTWPECERWRYLDAEMRHAIWQGPQTDAIDKESGLPAKWHVLFNLMADIELEERKKEKAEG